jgi:hypothetical protein
MFVALIVSWTASAENPVILIEPNTAAAAGLFDQARLWATHENGLSEC